MEAIEDDEPALTEEEWPEPTYNHDSSPEDAEDWDRLTRHEKALRVLDLCMSSRATLYIRLQAAKLALELEKSKDKESDPMDNELRKLITRFEDERSKTKK